MQHKATRIFKAHIVCKWYAFNKHHNIYTKEKFGLNKKYDFMGWSSHGCNCEDYLSSGMRSLVLKMEAAGSSEMGATICKVKRHYIPEDSNFQDTVNFGAHSNVVGWEPMLQAGESRFRMLEKKCEYNETVHHLFIDFKKTYDSARREVL
jgi:hypothetical protein